MIKEGALAFIGGNNYRIGSGFGVFKIHHFLIRKK